MAAEAAPPDPTDLLQDLPLDSKVKAQDAPQGGALPRAPIRPYEWSATAVLQEYMNPNMCYISSGYPSSTYYFGGYDGLLNDGAETPSHGVYGYGNAPYGSYFPAAYYQPPTFYSASYIPSYIPNQTTALHGELSTSAVSDQPLAPVDTNISSGVDSGNTSGKNGSTLKKNRQNLSPSSGPYPKGVLAGGPPPSSSMDSRFDFGGNESPVPWSNGPEFADRQQILTTANSVSSTISDTKNNMLSRNQNLRPLPNFKNLHTPRPASWNGSTVQGRLNRLYPNN